MAELPDDFRDLFEGEAVAHFSTLLPDGSPHVVPVWIDHDPADETLLVNTVRGSRKERNVRADPRVALSIVDPDDPYRFVAVRGEVTDTTEAGAVEHVNELARRYLGVSEYPRLDAEREPRVLLTIRPEHVTTQTPPEDG